MAAETEYSEEQKACAVLTSITSLGFSIFISPAIDGDGRNIVGEVTARVVREVPGSARLQMDIAETERPAALTVTLKELGRAFVATRESARRLQLVGSESDATGHPE